MRLSNSELLSLLKRALEGSGWTKKRYLEPAQAILWLESHGIKWLENLPNVWPRLLEAASSKPDLIRNHTAESVIDASGSSLLYCGPNAIDLAYTNACVENLASVEIRNCMDQELIVAGLTTLARRGSNALARWYSDSTLHIATIGADEYFPEYTKYTAPTGNEIDTTSLFLICSRDAEGMNHYRRSLSKLIESHTIRTSYSPEQFKKYAEDARATGIEIPDAAIELLIKAGNRMLVATSEQSRQGAG